MFSGLEKRKEKIVNGVGWLLFRWDVGED